MPAVGLFTPRFGLRMVTIARGLECRISTTNDWICLVVLKRGAGSSVGWGDGERLTVENKVRFGQDWDRLNRERILKSE